MEGDGYQCNKHETLEDLLEFYKKAASNYDKVRIRFVVFKQENLKISLLGMDMASEASHML